MDAVISIAGSINSGSVLNRLAEATMAEGTADWDVAFFSESDIVHEILRCNDDLEAFSPMARGELIQTAFISVRTLCREAGLSYVMYLSEEGEEGWSLAYRWAPGMTREDSCVFDGTLPMASVREIKEGLKDGIEGVNKLAARLSAFEDTGHVDVASRLVERFRNAPAVSAIDPC